MISKGMRGVIVNFTQENVRLFLISILLALLGLVAMKPINSGNISEKRAIERTLEHDQGIY